MSDLNLRDYLALLDELLHEGAGDEVLWHARHILHFYPKNVDAYRYIGRALMELGRWDEAASALKRVLSVIPNDRTAHILLSDINQHKHQNKEAVWHMERAFEQDPSDSTMIIELQRLYREYRGIANPRIQLTTAAVARQNIRSRDFDRAITALRAALSRSSARVDLQLLLAEALWQRGEQIDAAEIAMDVLSSYPDSLEANAILAELWLSEGRPSDAQRFLKRVEAIDPYRAMAIVQKNDIADETFRLPLLDYQKGAQAELATSNPDWLVGLGASSSTTLPETDMDADTSALEFAFDSAFSPTPDDEKAPGPGDDWINELDAIELNYSVNTGTLQATTSALINEDTSPTPVVPIDLSEHNNQDMAFDWSLDDDAAQFAAQPTTNLQDDEPDLMDWAVTSKIGSAAPPSQTNEPEDEDPLAWMKSSGIELQEPEASNQPNAGWSAQQALENEPEADPFAWLKEYNTDVIEEPAIPAETYSPGQPSTVDTQEIEANLAAKVDDFAEDDDLPMPDFDNLLDDWTPQAESPFISSKPPVTMPLPSRNIPDMGHESDAVLDEWTFSESLVNDPTPASETFVAPEFAVDSLNEIDLESFERFESSQVENMALAQTSELPSVDMDDWPHHFAGEAAESTTPEGEMMPDQNKPDFDWQDSEDESTSEQPSGATGILDWLNKNEAPGAGNTESLQLESDAPPTESATGSTGMLDWLANADNPAYDVQPSAPAESAVDGSTGSTGMLDWLAQDRTLPPTTTIGSEPPADPMPTWLNELDDDAPSETTSTPATGTTGMLDWIQENELPSGTTVLEPESKEPTGSTEWLNEIIGTSFEDDASFALEQEEEPLVDQYPVTDELVMPLNDESYALTTDWLSEEVAGPEAEPEDLEWAANVGEQQTAEFDDMQEAAAFMDTSAIATDWLQEVKETDVLSDDEPLAGLSEWATASLSSEPEDESPASELPVPSLFSSPDDDAWMGDELLNAAVTPEPTPFAEEDEDASFAEFYQSATSSLDAAASEQAEPAYATETANDEFLDDILLPTDTLEPMTSDDDDLVLAGLMGAGAVDQAVANANQDAWDESLLESGTPQSLPSWMDDDNVFNSQTELDEEDLFEAVENQQDLEVTAVEESFDAEEPLAAQNNELLNFFTAADESTPFDEDEPKPEDSFGFDLFRQETVYPATTANLSGNASEDFFASARSEDDDFLSSIEEEAVETADEQEQQIFNTADETDFSGMLEDEALFQAVSEEISQSQQPQDDETSLDDLFEENVVEASEPAEVPGWLSEAAPAAGLGFSGALIDRYDATEETNLTPEKAETNKEWDFDAFDAEAEEGKDLFDENVAPAASAIDAALATETVEVAPASNAPDWLNAMVPGLDIDTSVSEATEDSSNAPQDESAEAAILPEDFAWLNEIVTEETRADAPVAAIAVRAPRFIFSRPPKWLRQLWEQQAAASASAPESDLPDWLR